MPPSTATRNAYPYRMRDLCEATGLTRQAIYYYVQQGLLPPGHKTSRNMAYYSEEHLERLQLIQRLQHERFLPLKAIKAILDGDVSTYAPEQRKLLLDVKSRLSLDIVGEHTEADRRVPLEALCQEHQVRIDEVRAMAELGLTVVLEGKNGQQIPTDDAWLVELWGKIRAAGLLDDLGLSVQDMEPYEALVSALFEHEKALFLERLLPLPAERSAALLERALPLIHEFLARYHRAQIRNFFRALEA